MIQNTVKPTPRLLTLHAVTFLHPGTGQTTGVVDLPVQREVHTAHPFYASSGLKGALRDKVECRLERNDTNNHDIAIVFGGDNQTNPSAGSLTLTDARILAFPVRSLQRVFVWITCPMIIKRMKRDMELIGYYADQQLNFDEDDPAEGTALVIDDYWEDPLVLEELALSVRPDPRNTIWAKLVASILDADCGFCKERLVILSDSDFRHFVETATQISARIKLNDNKTTTGDGGNLWYEESLPPETILYSLLLFHQPRQKSTSNYSPEMVAEKLEEWIEDGFLQIGGNETVGQGWCRIKLNQNINGS